MVFMKVLVLRISHVAKIADMGPPLLPGEGDLLISKRHLEPFLGQTPEEVFVIWTNCGLQGDNKLVYVSKNLFIPHNRDSSDAYPTKPAVELKMWGIFAQDGNLDEIESTAARGNARQTAMKFFRDAGLETLYKIRKVPRGDPGVTEETIWVPAECKKK